MKKYLWLVLAMLMFSGSAFARETIYFFTKDGCPYCQKAAGYIKSKYPDLQVRYMNIKQKANLQLLVSQAKRFKVDLKQLGTPFISNGDDYILGWSEESERRFDNWVKKQ